MRFNCNKHLFLEQKSSTIVLEILVKVILAVMKQLKQLQRKPRKNYGSQTHGLSIIGAMLYQLSCEALL